MLRILLAITALMLSFQAGAVNYVGSPLTQVKFMTSYNAVGDGYVMFKLDTNHEDCSSGYWLMKNDPGFDANFSMLVAAFQADSTVRIYGLPEQRWPVSNGEYCKIYSVEYHK